MERKCLLCSWGGTSDWEELQPVFTRDKRRRHPTVWNESTADAKWLLTRNIWGCQARVPRVIQGVALGLEGVGGLEVLGTLSDLTPVLRSSQGFLHLKFARTRENQFVLGQHSGPFPSVPELVLHYSSRPLPVQGAEHLALLYPVVSQTP